MRAHEVRRWPGCYTICIKPIPISYDVCLQDSVPYWSRCLLYNIVRFNNTHICLSKQLKSIRLCAEKGLAL